MNYANIKYFDIADGEGVRTSLFVSGCRRGCKNCFNSVAWDFAAGEPFNRAVEDKIIESLDHPFIDGLTILGGEPMEPENRAGLVDFIERVRATYPAGSGKAIWCFTGDVLEELMPGGRHHTEVTDRILACLDMLVDGPFVQDLYDISLRFRGSSNQRVIDAERYARPCRARGRLRFVMRLNFGVMIQSIRPILCSLWSMPKGVVP